MCDEPRNEWEVRRWQGGYRPGVRDSNIHLGQIGEVNE